MNGSAWHAHATRGAAVLTGCTALVLGLTAGGAQVGGPRDPARQVLGAHDGWASEGPGTTGGAAADPAHVYTVTTWEEFRAALAGGGDAPRIVEVRGVIDAVSQGCDAFAADGYDLGRYLAVHNAEIPGEFLRTGAGWTPTLRTRVDHPRAVPGTVDRAAGAGRLR